MYEIDAAWADGTPAVVASGYVVSSEWRVNVNDDAAAPSNDPVNNVTFTATVTNGRIASIPDLCLTSDVDPLSGISTDGLTLTCNIGTQDQGTAAVVVVPVTVDGATNDTISLTGQIDGQNAGVPEIPIVNTFGMDMRWGTPNDARTVGTGYVDVPLQWTLSTNTGSDPGPNRVEYLLNFAAGNGSTTTVAPAACSAFDGSGAAGHPWSTGNHSADQMAPFVQSCTLVKTGATTYTLTLNGIDYSRTQVPTRDSRGTLLPTSQQAVASGQVVFRIATTTSTGTNLTANAPTYVSPSGQTAVDDAANNTSTKTITFGGTFASIWNRSAAYMNVGGTNWDDSIRVSPGATLYQQANASLTASDPGATTGTCSVIDTRYAEYVRSFDAPGWNVNLTGAVREWYVGNNAAVNPDPANTAYNPANFNCGVADGGWTTTEPTNLASVKAVRITLPIPANRGLNYGVFLEGVLKNDVQAGQDVWQFGNSMRDGVWSPNMANGGGTQWQQTPDARYPATTTYRDILRVIVATPAVEKTVDRSVVRPGLPATYTLTYSANGTGQVPPTVDGFRIVDTLPVGMTYVPGSASPEPTVTTNPQGRQVLTWVLDGVTTNVQHPLTYQSVADDTVAPGQTLTNSVTANYSGVTTLPDTAQVTVSTSGTTTIGKAADTPYIPNLAGDGVGEGSWTVTLRSFDPLPQAFTDTIDILPFIGDDRGTDFAGSYELTGVDAVAGATVYYTTADPATLSDDPDADANGAAGDPTDNTAGWTTTFTPDATAVRVIGPELAPGATQAFTVNIATDGVEGEDVLVNRAQARTEHTELVMRTSASIAVANYYSASLKKYVMGADGEWHDANSVEDYPTYRVGDTVPYRIVIENTGQGTLTDLEITDDLFPEGSFTVDELAPGAEAEHTFDVTLTEGGLDTVVNTACATAATPADSQVPPTINCDPAGIEVDGDPTHTKELVSATAIGGGQWQLVYGIDVTNTSTHPTSYDMADTLRFTDQATIVSAEVTASPTGVTLADPAWDGQGETLIASDVPLLGTDDAGYAAHRYEVTVIADVPLQLEGAGSGADDPTQCGAEGDDADRAFNNTSQLTDPEGATEDDQACAEIPSIDIAKGVSSGPTPNGDGTWTVTYDIVATNTGAAAGVYDVRDQMTADGDLEVISGAVTSAPDGVITSPTWTGLGADGAPENDIATGVTLPAGGVHTYQVEVVIGLAEGTEGAPVITDCSADPGGAGGLSNSAEIEHNDLTDDATACITIGFVTVDKTVSSGPTPNGDGTWTVVYDIVATHVGAADADYDVTDRLHFGAGIEIVDHEARSLNGVVINPDWTGLGAEDSDMENLIAEGVTLSQGESHTYQVEVTVQMDEATIDPSELVCAPPGSGEAGGLGNSTTLTSNGIAGQDDVCPPLPLILLNKTVADGSPIPNGDGTWTVSYDVTATNLGQATGDYDISDRLRYGAGIEVETASVVNGDGIATNAGWTGQGADGAAENVIASDVALDAGEVHTYRVEVIASMDREVVTPGDLVCPAPGSGDAGGFSNTAGLTHNGEDQDADACVTPPLITIAKSLSGAVTPVDGQDGVYDATYEITVTNSGPGAGVYNLDDELAPGEGVTVVGIQDATSDAPDPVAINAGFDGIDDLRIVTAQPIAGAADGAPVVHTYTVTVRYAADLSGVEVPAGDTCLADNGEPLPGTLNNTATVGWNGLEGEDAECIVPGKPTLDKAIVSANPIGNGQWEVVYDLTVGNTGTEATTYDLDDEFLFAPQVTVDTVSVTGPEGVSINGGFDGDSDQRIATDVDIIGLDDDGYTPHVYRVTVIANVPLTFDPADVGADGTASPACTTGPGGNFIEQGLNNAATLTDENGGTIVDTDCAGLPSTKITKTMDGAPVKGAGDRWTVNYTITVLNDGAVAGDYTMTDQLRYGAGIEVLDARITAPDGVTPAATWTGLGETGADENVVAADVALAAGATHTYRVTVETRLDTAGADGTTLACPAPGSGNRGGFANTAGFDHNDLTADASACEVPEWPEDVPPPLAVTGGTIAIGTIGAALLLLTAGGILLYARRRNVAAE
ncbi:hypothetical protein [Microbacterium sp.]|uniref:DUF7507 domain-containing protein n=1 Tax=Microbacterium sp. TaxID=51671 RepID=UPI002811684F|nr:hypothetical protein [Microbacterium sp.]